MKNFFKKFFINKNYIHKSINDLKSIKELSSKIKKKNIIIVSGNINFVGNSKYFYLDLVKKKKNH